MGGGSVFNPQDAAGAFPPSSCCPGPCYQLPAQRWSPDATNPVAPAPHGLPPEQVGSSGATAPAPGEHVAAHSPSDLILLGVRSEAHAPNVRLREWGRGLAGAGCWAQGLTHTKPHVGLACATHVPPPTLPDRPCWCQVGLRHAPLLGRGADPPRELPISTPTHDLQPALGGTVASEHMGAWKQNSLGHPLLLLPPWPHPSVPLSVPRLPPSCLRLHFQGAHHHGISAPRCYGDWAVGMCWGWRDGAARAGASPAAAGGQRRQTENEPSSITVPWPGADNLPPPFPALALSCTETDPVPPRRGRRSPHTDPPVRP